MTNKIDYIDIKTWGEKFSNNKVTYEDLVKNIKDEKWKDILNKNKKNIDNFCNFVSGALLKTKGQIKIFPYPDLVFNAFIKTTYENVKIIIIGQDSYFNSIEVNGKPIPQAMGLCFSVPSDQIKEIKIPSSLNNIYKNLLKYDHIKTLPKHGNLENWANQGCLLINSSLTVQSGFPNGHQDCWTGITDNIIENIAKNKDNLIFVLWGKNAMMKKDIIEKHNKTHKIIISSHPSGLSCNKPLSKYKAFVDQDHFGMINDYLRENKKEIINWNIN
jgi:uracil-DNA glycosylase